MENLIPLKGDKVTNVYVIGQRTFSEFLPDGKTKSKNAGKPYWLCKYNHEGTFINFTVQDEAFVKAQQDGDVGEIELQLKNATAADGTAIQRIEFVRWVNANATERIADRELNALKRDVLRAELRKGVTQEQLKQFTFGG